MDLNGAFVWGYFAEEEGQRDAAQAQEGHPAEGLGGEHVLGEAQEFLLRGVVIVG
jgi:hypothetical protein